MRLLRDRDSFRACCRNGSRTVAPSAAQAARMADAAQCAALIAGCAGRLSHASDEWRRPGCREGRPLRHRVNSYFRKQTGVPERTLEMLSQARGISFDVAPTASRRLSSSLTKSSSIDRRITSRSPSRTARYGSRHRISRLAARTRRHSVRSDRFLRPECSMNLVRSPPLRVARSAPVAGVPTRSLSKQVTRGSARCT